jgi:tetratricopeptide (TPR) repeat protein
MNIGNTLLQRGDIEEAAEQLQQAEDYFEKAQLRDLLPELYGLKAELALHQDRLDDAESIGQEALSLARELEMPREEGHNLRVLGQVAQARGEYSLAEKHLQTSYQILSDASDDYERAKTQLILAHLFSEQGRADETLAALAICQPIFKRLEASIDLRDAQKVHKIISAGNVPGV